MKPAIVAIDPGEVHCGVATFLRHDGGWKPTFPVEQTPNELYDWLDRLVGRPTIVIEDYVLYPWLLQQQGFSQVRTVRVIGVVERICGKRKFGYVEQPASIKKPTFGVLRHRGIELRGTNQHMKDAEAHGWHYILNTLKEGFDAR